MSEVSKPTMEPSPLVIQNAEGRILLAVRADGSWELDEKDIPEAVAVFEYALRSRIESEKWLNGL